MQCKRFFEAEITSSKGDENLITFKLWNGKSIDFVAVVTTLKGFKVWTQHNSKRNH